MRHDKQLNAAMAECPLIAILRGIQPDEVVAIADVLVGEGFTLIEVPLNSPDPMRSIAAIANRYPAPVMIGAGTVLSVEQVAQVHAKGAKLIVSPNTDLSIIGAASALNLTSLPGYFTPSEAFAALRAGASGLKLFPAEAATPQVLRAHRAVLPREVPIFVVGGIKSGSMAAWQQAGAQGFGLGSALYSAGDDVDRVRENARCFKSALGT